MPPLGFYAAWDEADGNNANEAVAAGSQVNVSADEGVQKLLGYYEAWNVADGTTETPMEPQEETKKKKKKRRLPQPRKARTVELSVKTKEVKKEPSETDKSEADEEERKAAKYYKYFDAWRRVKEENNEDEQLFEWVEVEEEVAASTGAASSGPSSSKPAAVDLQSSKAVPSDADIALAKEVAKALEALQAAPPEVKWPPWHGRLPLPPPPATQRKACPTRRLLGSALPAEPALPPKAISKVPGSARPAEPALPPRPIPRPTEATTPMSGLPETRPGPQMWPPKAAPVSPPPPAPNVPVRGHADKRADGKYYATRFYVYPFFS